MHNLNSTFFINVLFYFDSFICNCIWFVLFFVCILYPFDDNPNFNSIHKRDVETFIRDNQATLFNTSPEDCDFNKEFMMADLESCIASLKRRSAPGPDGIKNSHLIKLPDIGKCLLLRIANASWNHNCIIDDWKISQVTMIVKNQPHQRRISHINSDFGSLISYYVGSSM